MYIFVHDKYIVIYCSCLCNLFQCVLQCSSRTIQLTCLSGAPGGLRQPELPQTSGPSKTSTTATRSGARCGKYESGTLRERWMVQWCKCKHIRKWGKESKGIKRTDEMLMQLMQWSKICSSWCFFPKCSPKPGLAAIQAGVSWPEAGSPVGASSAAMMLCKAHKNGAQSTRHCCKSCKHQATGGNSDKGVELVTPSCRKNHRQPQAA